MQSSSRETLRYTFYGSSYRTNNVNFIFLLVAIILHLGHLDNISVWK